MPGKQLTASQAAELKEKAAALQAQIDAAQRAVASDAAQQIYAETNHEFPVKSGVAMSPLLQSWGNFSPDSLSLSDLAALRPQALSLIETVDFDG